MEVAFVPDRGRHGFTADDIIQAMTPRTRVVELSLVNFTNGYNAPLEEVGRTCAERGVLLAGGPQ
ncbi:hypothetical protein ACI8AF_02345 [Blastococcus sp. SYSU D00669]